MSITLPGKIIEEYTERSTKERKNRIGLVRFGDTDRPIILDLVPNAKIGDYVHVHVGFATDVVPEREALRAYEMYGSKSPEKELEAEQAMPETTRRQRA